MDFQQFTALGDSIRASYGARNFNEALFPEIAAKALAQADLKTEFDLESVADIPLRPVKRPPRRQKKKAAAPDPVYAQVTSLSFQSS